MCLDGDGSALMHLGSQIYSEKSNNLIHILINNGVHDSVSGQKIAGENIKFHKIASYLGYQKPFYVEIKKILLNF